MASPQPERAKALTLNSLNPAAMNRIGLYQNVSVSITLATVLSVLAKLAMQHHESGHT